jgi:hypothetical protein
MLNATAGTYNGVTIEMVRNPKLNRPVENKFQIIGKFCEADSQVAIPEDGVNRSLLKIGQGLKRLGMAILLLMACKANMVNQCAATTLVRWVFDTQWMLSGRDAIKSSRTARIWLMAGWPHRKRVQRRCHVKGGGLVVVRPDSSWGD